MYGSIHAGAKSAAHGERIGRTVGCPVKFATKLTKYFQNITTQRGIDRGGVKMDNYLIISYFSGVDGSGYRIRAEYNGVRMSSVNYIGYSKREAIRRYRDRYDLKNKKFIMVEW